MGPALKASLFGGTSPAEGILLEKVMVEDKQRNSVRGQLNKNSKKLTASIPNDGCLNFTAESNEVLIVGFGCKDHAVGDIPGVHFKLSK